jgi:photosystem II stability/assembly factor-like uncharacterized protein
MHRTYVLLTSLCLALSFAFSQQAAKKATPRAAAKKSTEPRFKAIWEPVNVKDDLKLFSVHFVSPDEGWVAGGRDEVNGGVILHTKDGGATWETQLGDSQSSDRAYRQMRFLGPTLGWVTQSTSGGDHNLLRTNDGMNWSPAGTVAQHRTDYWFTSEQVGFVTSGPNIERTQDGGRHWQPAYRCQVNTEVNGLTRRLSCEFESIFFVDSNVGYALSHAIAQGAGFVLAKTTDGGATWQTSVVLPGEDAKESSLWFSDENHGVMRPSMGRCFTRTMAASPGPRPRLKWKASRKSSSRAPSSAG